MNFSDPLFVLVFLPLTLVAVFLATVTANRAIVLAAVLGASAVFYASYSLALYGLLLGSILFNHTIGRWIDRPGTLLAIGVAGNLGLLGMFKYADFVLREVDAEPLGLALPLAISFYTFQQVSFLADRAAGRIPIHPALGIYAAYVTFFPQLVAGPIVRFNEVARRLSRAIPFVLTRKGLQLGVALVICGLFKKIVLADTIALIADPVFANPAQATFLDAWIGALAFGLQIYFDFSAYTDIAIGCGLMLGIRLPVNFRSPYRATSITDFWRRWHITLSRFLRDYLYVPLGGNRVTAPRRVVNLFTVMLLGGLWHGAAWTFVLWGGLHGAFIAIHRLWRGTGLALPRQVGWAITFAAVTLAWVPFRAASFAEATTLWRAMLDVTSAVLPPSAAPIATAFGLTLPVERLISFNLLNVAIIIIGVAIVLIMPTSRAFAFWRGRPLVQASLLGIMAGIALIFMFETSVPFIYFIF